MVFNLSDGLGDSSIKYRSRRDGRAKNNRISAGRIVQIISISWASNVNRDVKEFIKRDKKK